MASHGGENEGIKSQLLQTGESGQENEKYIKEKIHT